MNMASLYRVTITLPEDLVREVDRQEKNRSKFVADAVRRELQRRRHEELLRSLENPHPESIDLAEEGFDDWASGLTGGEAEGLLDPNSGTPVQWVPGDGWKESE
jgi:hypothetical protein